MPFPIIVDTTEGFHANIKVIGVGGGGCNAIEHMIDNAVEGITFIAANTDQQVLNRSRANLVIPLGKTGLGAGAKPEIGMAAAQDAEDQIREAIEGANLLFITAGMGGGTGTGAAPVIAHIAKSMGILTVAVVTKPFEFEGYRRMKAAEKGIEMLLKEVDSLLIILNDKLEDAVGEDTTLAQSFAAADDVLYKACNGITEIIYSPGLINVDFEDLRTVMSEQGIAMMGTAVASGPDRARLATEEAIACPLLEGANLQGARGLLVYITASSATMRQQEIKEVMSLMRNFVNKNALIIMGSSFDDTMEDGLRVTVVATGLSKVETRVEKAETRTRLQTIALPPQEEFLFLKKNRIQNHAIAQESENPFNSEALQATLSSQQLKEEIAEFTSAITRPCINSIDKTKIDFPSQESISNIPKTDPQMKKEDELPEDELIAVPTFFRTRGIKP